MVNEKETNQPEIKMDTTSQGAVNGSEANPVLIANKASTEKVTSIIPPKGGLEPLRPTKYELGTESIHVVHILFFIGAIAFLFAGMWKFGKKTKF